MFGYFSSSYTLYTHGNGNSLDWRGNSVTQLAWLMGRWRILFEFDYSELGIVCFLIVWSDFIFSVQTTQLIVVLFSVNGHQDINFGCFISKLWFLHLQVKDPKLNI